MELDSHQYYWPKLISGTLIKRYKRFLADVALPSGKIITAHCANSGAMTESAQPGRPVFLSCHDNPKRKLKYTWELIEMPTSLVGVNTIVPNKLVKNAILAEAVPELSGYSEITPEVKTTEGSRLDLRLEADNRVDCYVEIKNCTLVRHHHAYFPDARTTRGQKHLFELIRLKQNGFRAVMFFLIQRMDAAVFSPATDIDPDYSYYLNEAVKQGVEILVYDTHIDLIGISLRNPVEYNLTSLSTSDKT